jgi:hypothetical protein
MKRSLLVLLVAALNSPDMQAIAASPLIAAITA